ncbi:MAG: DUF1572 domain-containing protein [Flavobacteriales bacterium]|nr:DUF1572 domain-containing protein [Flavobacteriales bacterium]
MIQAAVIEIMLRDLSKMQEELRAYTDESVIWKTPHGISNSAGNLALHVAGNLQHFIGAILGNTGYVRQRELEFSTRDMPLADVVSELENAKSAVSETLRKLADEDLKKPFPVVVFREGLTCSDFIIHLVGHTNYHLGQINYHRRLLNA